MKTIESIKRYPTTLEVCFNDGNSDTVDFDQTAGEFTREHWTDTLEQRGYDEESIEKVLNELEWTSNTPFFLDDWTLDDIAEYNDLRMKETTSERSGYPHNLKHVLTGFESFEQAEAIAEKFGLDLIWITRREGQQLWTREGTAYQPMEIRSEDFGDDYEFWNDTNSAKEYYYEILGDMVSDGKSFEAIREYIDKAEEVLNAIDVLDEDEMVVTYCGDYYRTQKVHCIEFDDGDGHYTLLAATM